METEVKELLEQAEVPSNEVTTLEVAEVVEHIGDYLSEVTSQVLWLMDVIPGLNNEALDKLEEQLAKDWDDSPIFEHVHDHIMATVNSYRQDKILKELDEKFKRLKALEFDYNTLNSDCEALFSKLTKKNFQAMDTNKYHSKFVDEAYEYYSYTIDK